MKINLNNLMRVLFFIGAFLIASSAVYLAENNGFTKTVIYLLCSLGVIAIGLIFTENKK